MVFRNWFKKKTYDDPPVVRKNNYVPGVDIRVTIDGHEILHCDSRALYYISKYSSCSIDEWHDVLGTIFLSGGSILRFQALPQRYLVDNDG